MFLVNASDLHDERPTCSGTARVVGEGERGMPVIVRLDSVQDEIRQHLPETIVAREGSELAAALRKRGWIARSGWRSGSTGERPIWYLRFEQPEDLEILNA